MERIYSFGAPLEYKGDGDDTDRYYLPARGMVFGLNSADTRVLLPDSIEMQDFAADFRGVAHDLEMQVPQTTMIPDTDYLLDIAIAQHVSTVSKELQHGVSYSVNPYTRTEDTEAWVEMLQRQGFDVSIAMPRRVYMERPNDVQHRGGWARSVHESDKLSMPEVYKIPYPISHVGTGREELIEAYDLVSSRSGKNGAFFKPVFSAGGFSLARIESREQLLAQYDRLLELGALNLFGEEMPVEIQSEIDGIKRLLSVQYSHGQIITPNGYTEQLQGESNWEGNVFNGSQDPVLAAKIDEYFGLFKQATRETMGREVTGSGGFDLAEVDDGNGGSNLIVVEHNGGRVTGAHPAIALAETLGVDDHPFMMKKIKGDPQCRLRDVWEALQKNGHAYEHGQGGIVPLLWMEGSSFFFVSGNSRDELERHMDAGMELVESNGLVKR